MSTIHQDHDIIPKAAWERGMRQHQERLRPVVQPHLERASRREPHPVIDFLFQYYPFSPGRLLAWSPGWGRRLEAGAGGEGPLARGGRVEEGIWILDPAAFPIDRLPPMKWVLELQRAVAARPGRFGCFGLHEWAMVYRADTVRHRQLPLRLPPAETARVVESMPVACSHYDAFRFFTAAARPLNRLQPTLERRMELEQPGCLHVNMDLYKWSSQFYPWISSDLIADCFLLALKIRETDMQASPYDLSGLGYPPIAIETPEGRRTYVERQMQFRDEAIPLRERLIGELERMVAAGDALARYRSGS